MRPVFGEELDYVLRVNRLLALFFGRHEVEGALATY